MSKTEKFIEKAKRVHSDKYNYDKVEYKTAKVKVLIYCNVHNEYFEQTPDKHLQGNGCVKCGRERTAASKQRSTKEFIKKANEVHKDIYDYTSVKYTKSNQKVEIICKKHGPFKQLPSEHLQGKGCKKCGYERGSKQNTSNSKKFIEKSIEVHGDKYDYSKVKYTNAKVPVIIICKKHGEFEQKPYHHTQGSGCQECGKESSEKHKYDTTEDFIRKAISLHEGKYTYENTEFKGTGINVEITCKEHGTFKQNPNDHLTGKGCPKCGTTISKSEKEIVEFLNKYTTVVESDRKVLEGHELDILLPNEKIAIEYNGLYWHSEKFKEDDYHLTKTNQCKEKGIQLIHIFEDEWRFKKEQVKERLLNIINKTENKVYARKTELREVDTTEAMKFLDENHLQGRVGGSVKLGLYYKEQLVALMTFGENRVSLGSNKKEGEYELLRFCNKKGTTVVGGASKLFKNFVRQYKPLQVISYADKRWSLGNMYEQIGFKKEGESKPNYFYTKGVIRENRFKYRKSELLKAGFDPNKTERDIMKDRGYYRIYDCGTIKFKFTSIGYFTFLK